MIRIIPVQQAYKTKFERQQTVNGLRFKCHGSCAYVGGDISPGCYGCFYSDAYYCGFILDRDFRLPKVCNKDCIYCFESHQVQQTSVIPDTWKLDAEWKEGILKALLEKRQRIPTEHNMQYYEFTGTCEPLLYMPVIKELMNYFRNEIDPFMGTKGWAKLYTNGTLLNLDNILRLRDLGLDEIRIHPGASNFSTEIYDNARLTVEHIPTVTIETPSWPPHRKKMFEMLPIIEDIGVKHLDICQIEITSKEQLERIEKALGNIELYQAFYPVMDDGGLVEDVMREVSDKHYSYSVLDCSGFVKQSRSALTTHSYWSILNRKYPPEWEQHRYDRKIRTA